MQKYPATQCDHCSYDWYTPLANEGAKFAISCRVGGCEHSPAIEAVLLVGEALLHSPYKVRIFKYSRYITHYAASG